MKKETFQQKLFSNRTRLYCVLDGANVPDLPKRLYDSQVPNYCLFTGDLAPDMLYVAPYVVYLSPDSKFTDWVFEKSPGNNWGVFVHSRHSIKEMRRHFRGLVNVYDEDANSMVFRFYDPRVIRDFLPTCNAGELKTFFGNVETFFAESTDGSELVSYQLENNKLKQTS